MVLYRHDGCSEVNEHLVADLESVSEASWRVSDLKMLPKPTVCLAACTDNVRVAACEA